MLICLWINAEGTGSSRRDAAGARAIGHGAPKQPWLRKDEFLRPGMRIRRDKAGWLTEQKCPRRALQQLAATIISNAWEERKNP
jgi:hypothetical protein